MSRGRPPYGLETMLRIHLMQNGWSLRDDAMEDVLIDTGTIRRFAGIDLAKDNILDATTISWMPPPSWRSAILWNNIT